MIPRSSLILFFYLILVYCSPPSSISTLVEGEGDTGIFVVVVGIFSNYQLKICTEIYSLYAFCIVKTHFLSLAE